MPFYLIHYDREGCYCVSKLWAKDEGEAKTQLLMDSCKDPLFSKPIKILEVKEDYYGA